MANPRANSRASLLANLRTGGVARNQSAVPFTADPSVGFNIPQLTVRSPDGVYQPPFNDGSVDQLADMMARKAFINEPVRGHHAPYTAAYDQQSRMYDQQQNMNYYQANNSKEEMARMHLQLMQAEYLRLQTMAQMNQYAEHGYGVQRVNNSSQAAQAQYNAYFAQALMSPALYGSQTEGRSYNAYENVPMTAGIDGKFSMRARQQQETGPYNPNDVRKQYSPPRQNATLTTSKSDSVATWRRVSAATVEGSAAVTGRGRPSPLTFSDAKVEAPVMVISTSEEPELADDTSSSKSGSSSSPSTPISGRANLTGRDEVTKKGNGARPTVQIVGGDDGSYKQFVSKAISQPIRQPRGPPAPVDELGDKNFAGRIRKLAIGGLNTLLEARERRDMPKEIATY
jgi:hypothetical protein